MKYLKQFKTKESYSNDILPQVSLVEDSVMFDSAIQVVDLAGVNTDLTNPSKDYKISGSTDSQVLKIKGKTLDMTGVIATGVVEKSTSNTVFSINEASTINISDSTFNTSTYNMIEIGLSSSNRPKEVTISGCKFNTTSNNAINVFSFQDDTILNIKDCHFNQVSNMLRISNMTGATGIVINIENCTIDKWETGEYSGMILLQEHPTGAASFSNITINIKNVTGPNGLITTPSSFSDICGTKDNNQIVYVYSDNEIKSYNPTIYPTINIE